MIVWSAISEVGKGTQVNQDTTLDMILLFINCQDKNSHQRSYRLALESLQAAGQEAEINHDWETGALAAYAICVCPETFAKFVSPCNL